jgi:hypothetical protein
VVSEADPPWSLIAVSYTGAVTFLSSSSSFILTRAEWTPFQTHCYSENVVAPRIEPRTSGFAARNSESGLTNCLLHSEFGAVHKYFFRYWVITDDQCAFSLEKEQLQIYVKIQLTKICDTLA